MQDAKVWKEIRKAWFNVVVEGIMKDYDSKKMLAQVSDLNRSWVMLCRTKKKCALRILNII